jgi:hypothetical protein
MPTQIDWRFCHKCNVVFFDGFPTKGRCPVDGAGHEAAGFMFVLPHIGFLEESFQLWTDGLRCHEETPGFGISESDEPFALVATIDLASAVPATEVVLHGPLGDVDDQENHTFPFRPFWQRPLLPHKAIFLAALLEHDNTNPEATRSAVAAAVQAAALATTGQPRERIVSETLSAMSAAAEPISAPGVVNRLIGPPAEVHFPIEDLLVAAGGGVAQRTHRFSGHGDYSVRFKARRG